jgi:hypothetical protein
VALRYCARTWSRVYQGYSRPREYPVIGRDESVHTRDAPCLLLRVQDRGKGPGAVELIWWGEMEVVCVDISLRSMYKNRTKR